MSVLFGDGHVCVNGGCDVGVSDGEEMALTEHVSVCPTCDHPCHAGHEAGGREEGGSPQTQVRSWRKILHWEKKICVTL